MPAKTFPGKKGDPDDLVYVKSPLNLRRKTGPLRQSKFNPVVAAQRHLDLTAREYNDWLKTDRDNLARAWKNFTNCPQDETTFFALNKAVHVIKGNAPILGCDTAAMLATPLATLLESCTNHDRVESIVYLAINAICTAIEENLPTSDPTIKEIVIQLNKLNAKCLKVRAQAACSGSNCSGSGCKAKPSFFGG